jgi:hypothetical protein
MDYVELKTGRIIEGVVIRQDTTAVYVTDWESRHLRLPPVQVFTRDEVSAIWFNTHPTGRKISVPYSPETGRFEFGGSAALQTWAASVHQRRYMIQLSLIGGYTVVPQFGFEVDADFMIPSGKENDPAWDTLKFGHQATLNILVYPGQIIGLSPFALIGGGSSVDVPLGDLALTSSRDVRNLVNFGFGVKWGSGKLGYRIELRHAYYSWTPDETTDTGVRVPRQDADATTIRVGLFGFF